MKIVIYLSGGGIRGIAHAGVLKALEENNIKIDVIGGTSAGGMVASLYAMGIEPEEIHILFKKHAKEIIGVNKMPFLSKLLKYSFNKKMTLTGFNNGEAIEKVYNKIAEERKIEKINQIQMPLVITTVDIMKPKEYIFTNNIPRNEEDKSKYIKDVTVGKAVRASSSFPGIFCPCEFKEHIFLDGGTLNNSPINEVKSQGADKIITVNFEPIKIDSNSSAFDIVLKAIDIMGNKIIEENMKKSDIILTIPIKDKVGFLDVNKIEDLYNYGFNETMKKIEDIKKLAK